MRNVLALALILLVPGWVGPAFAAPSTPFFFTTDTPDGKIATASRPEIGVIEIESADDFIAPSTLSITSATFTGLITSLGATPTIGQVVVEIYRVFPNDSDVGRTSGPPTFSTPKVPTRVNSPSDVALDTRDALAGTLTFTTRLVNSSFTALNSVQAGGIHFKPNQTTGGDGAVTGAETQFNVAFTTPFSLNPGHYFFIPQVQVTGGDFLWLSAPRPIVAPGTPFPPGTTDLQSWTRDADLDPDWLRVGTDIVGPPPGSQTAPTFNATFSLTGSVPEPGSMGLLAAAGLALALAPAARRRRHSRRLEGETETRR